MKNVFLVALFTVFSSASYADELTDREIICDLNKDGKYTTILDYKIVIDAFTGDADPYELGWVDLNRDKKVTVIDWGIFTELCPLNG